MLEKINTAGEAVNKLAELFKNVTSTPRLDARMLVAHIFNETTGKIFSYPEIPLDDEKNEILASLVKRRLNHEPVSKIIGKKGFWTLDFQVTSDTLDPRPDSETLVEAVLNKITDKSATLRILDLGTGTGCLLLALLSELPNAKGVGIDISSKAIEIARKNASNLGFSDRCEMKQCDWKDFKTDESFDILISNPPYIPKADILNLEQEVSKFDPILALDGGNNGLDAYRTIAELSHNFVSNKGFLALEIGIGQTLDVAKIFNATGFTTYKIQKDIANIDRCIIFDL